MGTIPTVSTEIRTFGDLLNRLGGVSPTRIRMRPLPGRATARDVLRVHAREDRLCELVDRTLVEKAMGYSESTLAGAILSMLRAFVMPRKLGLVSGESGMMKLFPNLVRIPDVAYASWHRFANRRVPKEPIPDLVPDLVVEVLSAGNTKQEMARKRREYFSAGVVLVWEVDPEKRTVTVYTSPTESKVLKESKILSGEPALPGFRIRLKELFAELDLPGRD